MSRLSTRILIVLLSILSLGVVGAPAQAEPRYPEPDPDPFYTAPADIGSFQPGDVVRTRKIDTGPYVGTEGWQVAFRSTNSGGNAIMGITTVLLPAGVHNPPLVSYQALINSLGSRCNPSRSLFNGELQDAVGAMLPIGRGWAISLPDYLGPSVAYGAAKLSGMVTLDSVKAVQKVAELGLADSPVAIAGYSGGGMATAWAAALAPSYAPEVNLVGVAEGGVPMNLSKMANGLGQDPHPAFGLAFAAAMGLEREYPDLLPLSNQLNDLGRSMRTELTNACTNDILRVGAGRSASQVSTSTSLLSSPEVRKVMDDNSVELYPGVPTAPVFEWHTPDDVLIPIDSVVNTISRYCAAGATVQSQLFPSPDHLTTAVLGLPTAFEYLQDRFDGVPAPRSC